MRTATSKSYDKHFVVFYLQTTYPALFRPWVQWTPITSSEKKSLSFEMRRNWFIVIPELSARFKQRGCLGMALRGDRPMTAPVRGQKLKLQTLQLWLTINTLRINKLYLSWNSCPKMWGPQSWTLKRKKEKKKQQYYPCYWHQKNVSQIPQNLATISPSFTNQEANIWINLKDNTSARLPWHNTVIWYFFSNTFYLTIKYPMIKELLGK